MTDHLVWIDCEMTGLDLARDALIEVAVLVTDPDLTVVDDGLDLVIHTADEILDTMVPYVRDMHERSGLTEAVRASTLTLGEAEKQLVDYVRGHVPDPRSAPLCGNSIATDRAFLHRDLPLLDEYLHYRMVDVSSIKELAKRWYPRVYQSQPQKGLEHRALADIHESVRELAYYRRTLFVPLPGPTLEEARAAAAAVTAHAAGGAAGSGAPGIADGTADDAAGDTADGITRGAAGGTTDGAAEGSRGSTAGGAAEIGTDPARSVD